MKFIHNRTIYHRAVFVKEKLQKEKERLEDQVSLLYKYYWYESEPDYSSSDNDRPMWGPYEDDEWQYRM